MSHCKIAGEADIEKAAALMEHIRSERPEFWPYGLNPGMFSPGNLFLISKSASEAPVGFVGWQEREMGGEKVGFYSIGVLPQYRHQGIAKEAVSRIIKEKSARVSRVMALVADGNVPSEHLAARLGVPVLSKKAGSIFSSLTGALKRNPRVTTALTSLLGGGTTAGVYDQFMPHEEGQSLLESPSRRAAFLTNFATGALGSGLATRAHIAPSAISPQASMKALYGGTLVVPPLKVFLGQKGMELEQNQRHNLASEALQALGIRKKEEAGKNQEPDHSTRNTLLGAGLLTGGLGLAGYLVHKALKEKAEAPVNITTQQGGRLKVTLPTRNKGDAETVLDLPFDQQQTLSNALRRRLELDTRRRLYAETKERVRKQQDRGAMRELYPQTANLPSQQTSLFTPAAP